MFEVRTILKRPERIYRASLRNRPIGTHQTCTRSHDPYCNDRTLRGILTAAFQVRLGSFGTYTMSKREKKTAGAAKTLRRATPGQPAEAPTVPPKQAKANNEFALTFSQAVAVLMRSPDYRNLPISALEKVLLPPLILNQCRVALGGAQQQGLYLPVALAAWAKVSPAVDARLAANLDKPFLLQAAEWSSGDLVWLVTVAGEPTNLPDFLKQLYVREFMGKPVKMRVLGAGGKSEIKFLGRPKHPYRLRLPKEHVNAAFFTYLQ